MKFNIEKRWAMYSPTTDGYIGEGFQPLTEYGPFFTPEEAHTQAAILGDENTDEGVYFRVVDQDGKPVYRWESPIVPVLDCASEDIPF